MQRKVYLLEQPLEEARQQYLEHLAQQGALAPGPPEEIASAEAVGRVTAEPVFAAVSSPHFHASAMDGLAVRAGDTFGATETTPLTLRVGVDAHVVDTGDPLPPDCNAVIMIEDVHWTGEDTFEITAAAFPWQYVRVIGEDLVAT
ncbi:MAG: molybdopterin biosynthesis protein, partial [Candidatus Desulforudis sp.]|nr:molybdopterin biosynthesis protein [Desulforudis sp.]